MRVMLPWPAPHDRRAAIASARDEKEQSLAGAAHAAVIASQIKRMAAENHFAAKIAEDLMARHRGDRA